MSYAMTVGSAFLQQQKKPSSKFFENLHSYNNFSHRLVIVRKRRFTNVKKHYSFRFCSFDSRKLYFEGRSKVSWEEKNAS